MSELSIKLYSEALKRTVGFEMFIPNDLLADEEYAARPMKTLFLLHGYHGCAGNYVPQHLCEKYKFAVVMPNGENSFWIDGQSTGHQYGTFLCEELVSYVRKVFRLALTREDTYIMGLSMGGFGAIHSALMYSDTFGKAAAMSSALIIHKVAQMTPGSSDDVANYDYYREVFGDPEKLESSENNPENIAKWLMDEGSTVPELFMSCGTEDFLLEENRQFHEYLELINFPHTYIESVGGHDNFFWDEYTVKFIDMMMK